MSWNTQNFPKTYENIFRCDPIFLASRDTNFIKATRDYFPKNAFSLRSNLSKHTLVETHKVLQKSIREYLPKNTFAL